MIDTSIYIIDTDNVGTKSFYESRVKFALAGVHERVKVIGSTIEWISDAFPVSVGVRPEEI